MWREEIIIFCMTANLDLVRASGGKLERETLALQLLNSLVTSLQR